MSEEYRDPVRELEDQMRAADALIESLDNEVVDLRLELEQASEVLRAAQEGVAARGWDLEGFEESERLRVAAEEQVRTLRAELVALRQQSADEQLRLRNEHIASIAALREELEEQRHAEIASAEYEGKIEALREEFRKERAALNESHKAEIEDLKQAAARWEEKLRDGYRNLEEHHKTQSEKLRREHVEKVEALEEEHRAEIETLQYAHSEEVEALRVEAEGQRIEVEKLKLGLEQALEVAEEHRKEDLKEVKRHAEVRERELRRAQAARLEEEK